MDGLSTRSLTGLSGVWERDGRMHATMIRLVTPIRSREQVQWPVAVAGARTYQCVLRLFSCPSGELRVTDKLPVNLFLKLVLREWLCDNGQWVFPLVTKPTIRSLGWLITEPTEHGTCEQPWDVILFWKTVPLPFHRLPRFIFWKIFGPHNCFS